MGDRLFLLDKNYLLKQVQSEMKLELQALLIEQIKIGYFSHFNPLRLPDDRSEMVEEFRPVHLSFFDDLYEILAGIYRYQIGDNQLEFLFDGRSHYDKYVEDWRTSFEDYANQLVTRKNFILAGLELTVFYDSEHRIELAKNRMRVAIFDHFGLKVYKYKGIQEVKSNMA